MSEDREPSSHVRDDHHLHWAAMIALSAYMWQLQGPLAAVAVFIGLIIAITVTNHIALARFASLKSTRWSRWGWVMAAFVLIIACNAQIGSVP